MRLLSQYLEKILEFSVVIILSVMSLLVFLNVVLRYGFNSSINVTEEVSRYLFVWLVFLGAILAFKEKQHVNVTFLKDKLSPFGKHLLSLFTDLAMLFCCYLMIDGSWIQFNLNLNNIAPISGLPQGINYLASFIAAISIGIILFLRLILSCSALIKGENQ